MVENWPSPGQVIKRNRHQGRDVAGESQNGYLRFYYLSSFKHNNEIIVTLNWLKTEIWLSVKFIVSSFTIQVWFPWTCNDYTGKKASKKFWSTFRLAWILASDQDTFVQCMKNALMFFFFLPCESKTNNNIILPQTFPSSCESQISCESWKGASGSSPACTLCVHTHPHYTPWNYPVSILTPPSQRGRGTARAQNKEVGTSFILEENHLSYWEVVLRLVQWETSRVTVWMPITFCCDVPSITVMANISCVNTIGRYCTS